MNQVMLLDCTLRDGGFCLEDAFKNNYSNLFFRSNDISDIERLLFEAKIDIIELGGIELTNETKNNFAIYKTIEDISKRIGKYTNKQQLFAGMFRGPDTPINLIPKYEQGLIEIPRVIIRYSELQKSLDFCKGLAEKGYKVCIQPMLTMRYTKEELELIIQTANDIDAYALYYVDSYGYMQMDDTVDIFNKFDNKLKESIKIGFHAHNNMNLALSNVLTIINKESRHDILIDSCILGMGQGAGNLQTELIIPYLNKKYNKNYDYIKILDACEIIEKYFGNNLWGYSVSRLLPAVCKVAYKYSVALRTQDNFSYSSIYKILSNIPDEMRHRYTLENKNKLIKMFGDLTI